MKGLYFALTLIRLRRNIAGNFQRSILTDARLFQRRSPMIRALTRRVLVGVCLTLAPAAAFAQASLAGQVKDPSGAVLPGVTVEAASPVLIEKVRSVITDGSGLYKIVDLRPGTYSVTFSLAGFSTT